MTLTALLVSLTLSAQTTDKPSVQYYQQEFVIRSHGREKHVPLQPSVPKPPGFIAFRKDEVFAVWDERGLTIRRGSKSSSTKLPDIATSPKAFSRPEILKTIEHLKSGDRTKDATALSGAKRIGRDAFFLVRWDDKSGKPWAEALIGVDLTSTKAKPEFLGRFDGLSMATKSVDDKLEILNGKLAIVEHASDSWGISTYDPVSRIFKTQPLGGSLISYAPLNTSQGLFIEVSSYGTTIAGRVDLLGATRKILYEGREHIRFLDSVAPETILASSNGKSKAVNCVTGAVRLIPYQVDARRIGDDVLFWTAPSSPTAVWLMSSPSWETLATWRDH